MSTVPPSKAPSSEQTPSIEEMLRTMAKSANLKDRLYAASNEKLPHELFDVLATDQESEVRSTLAQNQHCSPSALMKLSKDAVWEIRRMVCLHPKTIPLTLRSLAMDKDPWVKSAAEKRLKELTNK